MKPGWNQVYFLLNIVNLISQFSCSKQFGYFQTIRNCETARWKPFQMNGIVPFFRIGIERLIGKIIWLKIEGNDIWRDN